ncbi:epoxide hydrolase 4-like isoform X1 [Pararge aegeria]|uniref:epoxide hydrolase 4-like isoform X1 n=2 Tax=Pararge aegeria TaxID=116150 RepID=UPI0019CFE89A|nr:epoxide hydrolase 4-like isoform X1 [Pararge aegeria]
MSVLTIVYRFCLANVLTAYYCTLTVLFSFLPKYITNPFGDPWAMKMKLEPPASLRDPKYGLHKYIKVNNIKLHYVDSGDASKPLMLFLHGFPEFWYSWRHQIVNFNKDYRCVAVDMRGYGDSERPEGVSHYKIEILVDDIRDLIRQLGYEKCILISHDWGGLVACKLRDTYPEALHALVMLGSTSHEAWTELIWTTDEQRKMSGYVFMFRAPKIPELSLQIDNLTIFEQYMLVKGKDTTTMEDIECFKYWFCKQMAFTPPLNYYRANFSYTFTKKVHKENVPFLIAHGANDRYISHSVLDVMNEAYPNIETVIVDGVGHFMQQEEPVKVNKLISDLLTKHNL